jgi:hypothetical protein
VYRYQLALLVLLLALFAGRAEAQTCTHGPYTSATSVSTIESSINGAAAGSVICLRRGNTWTVNAAAGYVKAFGLTTSQSAGNEKIICASDATQCDDCPVGQSECTTAAGANPNIQMNDTGSSFMSLFDFGASDGYKVKFINSTGGSNTCSTDINNLVIGMVAGSERVHIIGGHYDGFPVDVMDGVFTIQAAVVPSPGPGSASGGLLIP